MKTTTGVSDTISASLSAATTVPTSHMNATAGAYHHQSQQQQHTGNYSKNAFLSSTTGLVKVCLLLMTISSATKLCEGVGTGGNGGAGGGSADGLVGTVGAIAKRSQSQHQALPECIDERSVCGYVQLNHMGISSQPICKCRAGVQCPMMWNPMDGRTVSHGNDQYKYCNRAPKLNYCSKEEMVYTTYLETSLLTMKTLLNTNHIHCLCPAHHLFVRNSTKFHDLEDGTTIIGTSFQCKPPPLCGSEDACLAVTEAPHSRFISRNCVCPLGMYCPNDVRLAAQRVDLNRGAYYIMNCI